MNEKTSICDMINTDKTQLIDNQGKSFPITLIMLSREFLSHSL